MLNNVNNFAAAKVASPQSPVLGQQYNYLIDMLSRAIKVLSITSAGGISVGTTGLIELGNELEALQALSDAAGFVKKTGDGAYAIDASSYQPLNNELTALSELADIAGFVKKTGDAAYVIDTNVYATNSNAIAYAIALGG